MPTDPGSPNEPAPPPTQPDPPPAGINPGIVRTVALLRSWGFRTTDSGDGITNVTAGMEGARDYPHVSCVVESAALISEANRLLDLLRGAGLPVMPIGVDDSAASIQASYDPALGVGIIDLIGLDDARLPSLP